VPTVTPGEALGICRIERTGGYVAVTVGCRSERGYLHLQALVSHQARPQGGAPSADDVLLAGHPARAPSRSRGTTGHARAGVATTHLPALSNHASGCQLDSQDDVTRVLGELLAGDRPAGGSLVDPGAVDELARVAAEDELGAADRRASSPSRC
jgi:hypothetical protein